MLEKMFFVKQHIWHNLWKYISRYDDTVTAINEE